MNTEAYRRQLCEVAGLDTEMDTETLKDLSLIAHHRRDYHHEECAATVEHYGNEIESDDLPCWPCFHDGFDSPKSHPGRQCPTPQRDV